MDKENFESIGLIDGLHSTPSRRYLSNKPISDEIIWDIIDAAIRGPSGGNKQKKSSTSTPVIVVGSVIFLFIVGLILSIDSKSDYSSYSSSTGETTSSISTTSTGNYSLSVVDGNGCTGTSNTTSVSISPQTITATTTGFSLCNGSVTLDAGSGFSSYQWYNNGTIMTNGTNQTFVATIAGNYTVGVTYPTGCTR